MHSNDHFPDEKFRYGVARRDEMLVARMALTLARPVEAVNFLDGVSRQGNAVAE
jgi:hypothetical protein